MTSSLRDRIPILDRVTAFMIRRNLRGPQAIRRLAQRICTSDEVSLVTRHRVRFQLRPTDYIDNIVIREGYYESEVLTPS